MIHKPDITAMITDVLDTHSSIASLLKRLHYGALSSDTVIKKLLNVSTDFQHALTLTSNVLGNTALRRSIHNGATDKATEFLTDTEFLIKDSGNMLLRLQAKVNNVHKKIKALKRSRKTIRVKWTPGEVSVYQEELYLYTIVLKLCMEVIALWSSAPVGDHNKDADQKLQKVHMRLRKVSMKLLVQIRLLEASSSLESNTLHKSHLQRLRNLQKCTQSAINLASPAAAISSPASTDTDDDGDNDEDDSDLSPSPASSVRSSPLSSHRRRRQTPQSPRHTSSPEDRLHYRTLIPAAQIPLAQAKRHLVIGEYSLAESLLHNYLATSPPPAPSLRAETIEALIECHTAQQQYPAAERLLRRHLSRPDSVSIDSRTKLTLDLAHVLFHQEKYAEARELAATALHAYRKLGEQGVMGRVRVLCLLYHLCHAMGCEEEIQRYEGMPEAVRWQRENLRGSNSSGRMRFPEGLEAPELEPAECGVQ